MFFIFPRLPVKEKKISPQNLPLLKSEKKVVFSSLYSMSSVKEYTRAQNVAVNIILDRFHVSSERLKVISEQFVKEMEKGLDHEGATSKSLFFSFFIEY